MSKPHYLPDGRYVLIPDDMPPEEADRRAARMVPEAYGIQQKHGGYEALKAGLKEGAASSLSGLGSFTGSETLGQWGRALAQPSEEPGAYRPTSSEDVTKAFSRGVFPGVGAAVSRYATEPLMGAIGSYAIPTAAAGAAGFLAPGAAIPAALARGAAFIGADVPAEQGRNIQEQEAVNAQRAAVGQAPAQFSQTETIAASLAQAALLPVFGALGGAASRAAFKAMGPDLAATARAVERGELSQEAAVAALQSTAKNVAVKTGEMAAIGVPMMTGTEALRMAQAGEDVTSPEAMARYKEAAGAALAGAPVFGALGAMGMRRAQRQPIEEAGRKYAGAEEQAKAIEAEQAQRAAAVEATPEGETVQMDLGVPEGKPMFPELAQAQAAVKYLKEQKAPREDIKAQQEVVQQLKERGPQPEAANEEVAAPTITRAYFNRLGVSNKGAGRELRQQFEGRDMTDPAARAELKEALTTHAEQYPERATAIERALKDPMFYEQRGLEFEPPKPIEAAPVEPPRPVEAAKPTEADLHAQLLEAIKAGDEKQIQELVAQARKKPEVTPTEPAERAAPTERAAEEPARGAEEKPVERAAAEPVREVAPKVEVKPEETGVAGKALERAAKREWADSGAVESDEYGVPYKDLQPEAKAHLQQVVAENARTGKPFTGRQLADVWVTHTRTIAEKNKAERRAARNGPEAKRIGEAGEPEHTREQAAQMVKNITSKWTNAPRVSVLDTAELAPEDRAWVEQTKAKGFIRERSGDTVIVSDRHTDLADVKATLFHEALGHYGLRAKFGKELNGMLRQMYDTHEGLRTAADKIRGMDKGLSLEEAVEEVLAERQIDGKVHQSLLNQIVAFVRDFMRRHGLVSNYTKNDVVAILRQAHDIVEKGEPPSGPLGGRRAPRVEEAVPRTEQGVVREMADKYLGPTGDKIVADAGHIAKRALGSMTYLHDLVRRMETGLPSAKAWYDGVIAAQTTRFQLERRGEVVATMASKLNDKSYTKVNDFIGRSTIQQKWGHQPEGFGRTVQIDPAFKAEFDRLTPEEQAVVDAVFKHGEDTRLMKQELFSRLGVDDVFTQKGMLEGPYAPLKRFGNFVTVLKSQKLLDAEKAVEGDPSKANQDRVETLKADEGNFQVAMFDTLGQAQQFAKENESKYAFTDAAAKSKQIEDKYTMSHRVLQRVLAAVKVNTEMPPEARKAMEDTVKAMYMSAVDQHNARHAAQQRKGIAGYDKDMIKSMLADSRAQAAYISNLEHGPDINEAFYRMKNEIKDPETKKRVNQDDFNLLAEHYAENLKYEPTPVQDGIVAATSAWQLSTSLGYHLANFSQVAMVTIPKLAADFGSGKYGEAWRHAMDGYRVMHSITKGMNTDLSKVKDPALCEALEKAANQGLLDVGIEEDLGHFDRFRTGHKAIDGTSAVASRALHKLRQVARAVEQWNRVSSSVAAYNMARANGRSVAEAQRYVTDVLQTTQGDFSRTGAPLILKKLPKVVVQYRKYQFMMMAFYAKAAHAAFKGATPEERAIGQRMLSFKLFHTAVASGLLGLPLMNLASLAYNMLSDSPDDLETKVREQIGSKDLADLLTHGPMSLAGLDMSAKLSDSNVFSIAPYTTVDLSSAKGMAATIGGIAGGPALSQAGRFASGIGLIQQGDMYKGAEKFMPKGLESAMQAFRMANEGFTMKNGDVLVKPEDISAYATVLQAMGLPPTQIKEITRNAQVQYQIKKYYADRTREIEQVYLRASKAGDREAMAELHQKWMELQKSKAAEREHFKQPPRELNMQPLSTLISVPRNAALRERRAQAEFTMG